MFDVTCGYPVAIKNTVPKVSKKGRKVCDIEDRSHGRLNRLLCFFTSALLGLEYDLDNGAGTSTSSPCEES